jgi:hypothetical protein
MILLIEADVASTRTIGGRRAASEGCSRGAERVQHVVGPKGLVCSRVAPGAAPQRVDAAVTAPRDGAGRRGLTSAACFSWSNGDMTDNVAADASPSGGGRGDEPSPSGRTVRPQLKRSSHSAASAKRLDLHRARGRRPNRSTAI